MMNPDWNGEGKEIFEQIWKSRHENDEKWPLYVQRASYNVREQDIMRDYEELFIRSGNVETRDLLLVPDKYRGCVLGEAGPRFGHGNLRVVKTIYISGDHYKNQRLIGYTDGKYVYRPKSQISTLQDLYGITHRTVSEAVDDENHRYMVDRSIKIDTDRMDMLNEFVDKVASARAMSRMNFKFDTGKYFALFALMVLVALGVATLSALAGDGEINYDVLKWGLRAVCVMGPSGFIVESIAYRLAYKKYKEEELLYFSNGYLKESEAAGGAIYAVKD